MDTKYKIIIIIFILILVLYAAFYFNSMSVNKKRSIHII
jgi:uncharacterized protein YpmB